MSEEDEFSYQSPSPEPAVDPSIVATTETLILAVKFNYPDGGLHSITIDSERQDYNAAGGAVGNPTPRQRDLLSVASFEGHTVAIERDGGQSILTPEEIFAAVRALALLALEQGNNS